MSSRARINNSLGLPSRTRDLNAQRQLRRRTITGINRLADIVDELDEDKEDADVTILKQAGIVNALNSTSTTAPLAAAQGKVLGDRLVIQESPNRTPYSVPAVSGILISGAATVAANGTFLAATTAAADALDDQTWTWAYIKEDQTAIYGWSALGLTIRALDGTWSTIYDSSDTPDPGPILDPTWDTGTEAYPTLVWLLILDPANGPDQTFSAAAELTLQIAAAATEVQSTIMLDIKDNGHTITLNATGVTWAADIVVPSDGMISVRLYSAVGLVTWYATLVGLWA